MLQPYYPSEPLPSDPFAPRNRPELAVHFAEIATISSYVDIELGILLSILLGTEAEIGVEMYLSLAGSAPRKAIFQTVAAQRLTKEGQDALTELHKKIKTAQDQRNNVIHGSWATVDDLPDALILCNIPDAIRSFVKTAKQTRGQ